MITESIEDRRMLDCGEQLEFCEKLMASLRRTWNVNITKEKIYSRQTIANDTMLANDARRLRRELLLFAKMLEDRR